MENKNKIQTISKQALQRLPYYLNFLKAQREKKQINTSASMIAEGLRLNQIQVRKDLASVSSGGRPKTGYKTEELIADIAEFLGYNNTKEAVLVGAGHLGKALISYKGFADCGIEIVAAFDTDEKIIGSKISGHQVFHINKIKDLVKRLNVKIGIIAVPAEHAQEACSLLVESGILAIWNFAPVYLEAPEEILIQNENMAASLAVLSKHLEEKLNDIYMDGK